MLAPLLRYLESLAADGSLPPRRRVSDAFPDVTVTNQHGEPRRFRRDFVDTAGALIVNTMYTTCRGSCPGTSSTIATLRRALSPDFGKRLTFLSITLEPQVDTPQVLRSYAKAYGAARPDPGLSDWQFLTMPPADLLSLRRSLGFFELDPSRDRDVTQHAALLLVGNIATDRWCKAPSTLRTPVLLDTIRRVAGFTFEQRYGLPRDSPAAARRGSTTTIDRLGHLEQD